MTVVRIVGFILVAAFFACYSTHVQLVDAHEFGFEELAQAIARIQTGQENSKWYQDAPMKKGNSWGLGAWVVDGHYITRRTRALTFNDTLAPARGEFYMVVNPAASYWFIRFRSQNADGTFAGWGQQLANATGAWAQSPGQPWMTIPGVTYTIQSSYQAGALDTSSDKCRRVIQGLIPDITSCGCSLQSSVTVFDATTRQCRLDRAHHAAYNKTGLEPAGFFLEQWDFMQHFSVVIVGGPFIVDRYSYDIPAQVVVTNPLGDYCVNGGARPPNCLPFA